MPRNPTTGVFTRVDNSFSEPVRGTIIDPTDADSLFDDYDLGLTESLGWYQPPRVVTAPGAVTVTNTETGVAINKTVGAATAVTIPTATARNANGGLPILIKDLKQDAGTNNITITPAAGTIDGYATWTIASDGAWVRLWPLADNTGYFVGP